MEMLTFWKSAYLVYGILGAGILVDEVYKDVLRNEFHI
jgi:hypothetical protein